MADIYACPYSTRRQRHAFADECQTHSARCLGGFSLLVHKATDGCCWWVVTPGCVCMFMATAMCRAASMRT